MKVLTCAATRRRLDAYHDEELSLSEQIAVSSHLEWCDDCAESLDDLRQLRDALRLGMPGRVALSVEDDRSLQATVVNRIKAEERLSFGAWLQEAFADMHLVYAGLSAIAAAIACLAVTLGMMRFATNERPDSTAAMVRVFATPGSNLYPVSAGPRVRMPRALDEPIWATPADIDAHYTLSAIVTREGRVGSLEILNSTGGKMVPSGGAEAKAVEDLIGTVSRARFEPASILIEPSSMTGLPVAVNVVWIVAHTTVRATKDPLQLRALRAARKRTA